MEIFRYFIPFVVLYGHLVYFEDKYFHFGFFSKKNQATLLCSTAAAIIYLFSYRRLA
jgi:hypothetical protein